MKKRLLVMLSALTLALAGVAFTATPYSKAPAAEAASYVSCYWAMNGYLYCWRYACTPREEMAGCYEGWVRRGYIYA